MFRLIATALVVVALLPGCKGKTRTNPAPLTLADAAPRKGPPSPTEPDLGYPARREELLRRGDPAMMQPAPVIDGSKPPEPSAADMIKVVSRDVMMVGSIRINLMAGTAEVPATVATVAGPLEYIAVGAHGKDYESLLTVTATAVELRLALTLLGYEGTVPGADGAISAPTPADTVLVALRTGANERPLATVLIDRRTGKPLVDAPWQVIGFRDSDRAAALQASDLMTLVPRDTLAPLRLTIDAGNPYAQNQGIGVDAARVPAKGAGVTLVFKRRTESP